MKIIDRMKDKYANHLMEMLNLFIDDAHLNFQEIRLLQRFISDYLLKDNRGEDV